MLEVSTWIPIVNPPRNFTRVSQGIPVVITLGVLEILLEVLSGSFLGVSPTIFLGVSPESPLGVGMVTYLEIAPRISLWIPPKILPEVPPQIPAGVSPGIHFKVSSWTPVGVSPSISPGVPTKISLAIPTTIPLGDPLRFHIFHEENILSVTQHCSTTVSIRISVIIPTEIPPVVHQEFLWELLREVPLVVPPRIIWSSTEISSSSSRELLLEFHQEFW